MDLFSNLIVGWNAAVSPSGLLYCLLGVTLGMLVGVLPGIGALAAISLLLPLTYGMDPGQAMIMLSGVYYGTRYGGSTASILLNLPGDTSAAVTCLDGFPMSKQGRAGVALFTTTAASFVGANIGLVILVMFSRQIAEAGLAFGPSEYFCLMVLGLVAASTMASTRPVKGIAMVLVGLLLGLVGIDVTSGTARYDFGIFQLMDGINLVALAMGLFGLAQVVSSVNVITTRNRNTQRIALSSMLPTRADMRAAIMPMLRGSAVGTFFGSLPGTGSTIASFVAYALEKRVSKTPDRFGKGAIEGIAAPESANNAAVQTAFIPSLTLGIPGDSIMALMLGALILHGITPGPLLMTQQPSLFWGLVVSFAIGNLFLVVLNIPLIGIWVSILKIPYRALYPTIVVFVCLGAYSANNSTFDILLTAFFGGVGYLLAILRLPAAPLLLGFILGPMMEENLRRTLLLSNGDMGVFLHRPVSAGLLFATSLILLWSMTSAMRSKLRRKMKLS